MKNLKTRILSMLLILVLLVSTLVIPASAESGQPAKYSSEYNSGQRGVVCTTLSGTSAASYYTGSYTYDALSQLSSSALQSQLKTLMTQTHSYKSSYNDCHYKADRTDCQDGDGTVLLIYTSYAATMSQWNGWNREHVWPQSLGGGNTSGGGADLHHVRPSDAGVNSSRGNKKYGEAGSGASSKTGTNPAKGYLGGYYNSTYFEPLDNVKGDVARICLYVWIRWGSSWGADSVTEVFQSIDVLLEWCELDPVDTWEMGRNEVVQDIQGNRNVFIDYPEYAWLVFGREVPDSLQSPSGEASNGSGTGSGSGSTTPDPDPTPCTHTSTEIKNKANATCLATGYTGDTYCKDCGEKLATGTVIAKTSHIWYAWTETEPGVMTRTCSSCRTVETKTYCAHSSTEVRNKTNATCTSTGYTGDTYCTVCSEKIATGTTVNKLPHSYGEWVINEAAQTKTRTCGSCSTKETVPHIPECTHTETELRDAVAATCAAAGYTGDTVCKACNEVITEGQTIPATGNHTDTELRDTKAPTCNEAGYTGNTVCKTCGTLISVGEVITATGNHLNTEIRDAKDATCATDGYTGNTFCKDCGEQIALGQTVPATGNHAWGDVVVSVQPEQGKDGLGFSTCSGCGESKSVVIDALPSVFGAGYENNCEKIIAIVSKNALYTYIVGLLTGV